MTVRVNFEETNTPVGGNRSLIFALFSSLFYLGDPGRNLWIHKMLRAPKLMSSKSVSTVPRRILLFFSMNHSLREVVIIIYQCGGPRNHYKSTGPNVFEDTVWFGGLGEVSSEHQVTFWPFVWSYKVLILSKKKSSWGKWKSVLFFFIYYWGWKKW